MTRSFQVTLFALGALLVVGAVVIVMNGRPVADMTYTTDASPTVTETDDTTSETGDADDDASGTEDDDDTAPSTTETATKPATTSDAYTMADVATHSVASNCWSVVNGSVYDLTTWVERHPGGVSAITNMCGKDASSVFNRKHGSFPAAQSALGLLKIGKLAS